MKPEVEATVEHLISRLRVAATNFDLQEETGVVIQLLWLISECREDFQDLPRWICKHEQALRAAAEDFALFSKFSEIALITAAAYCTPEETHRTALDGRMVASSEQNFDFDAVAATVLRIATRLLNSAGGVKRLAVVIEHDSIRIGRHTTISFNRTLRIPEDGKDYPLPAGFGRLPILSVADYADTVPRGWLHDGGFFIPLYQKEALFLEFEGKEWQPSTAKVAVGGINAITGDAYDEKIRTHKQDYVVIPEQKWLDGINCGEGRVGQFVAMPLGQGYTIEEQVTDEAKFGGFQLAVFESKEGRFPEEDPEVVEQRLENHKRQMMLAFRDHVFSSLSELQQKVRDGHLRREPSRRLERLLGITHNDRLRVLTEIREILGSKLGHEALKGLEDDEIPEPPPEEWPPEEWSPPVLFSASKVGEQHSPLGAAPKRPPALYSGLKQMPDAEIFDLEMGIARGGNIQQKIIEDTYGAECWDETRKGTIFIHIVNSEMFEQITGRKAGPSPITPEEYQRYRIPWFDAYDEHARSLQPAKIFGEVRGISAMEKLKRLVDGHPPPLPFEVSADLVRRIKVPRLHERIAALKNRAKMSWQAGQYRIAHREASCLIELSNRNVVGLQIRADCNNKLGRYLDAACDATECLDVSPSNVSAMTSRAYASIKLGEPEVAYSDAVSALAHDPVNQVALRVCAEAGFRLRRYDEAIEGASKLLNLSPGHILALRLRAESHRAQGNASEAVRDSTDALNKGGGDAFTLCTRAASFLVLGNVFDAKRDAEEALRLEPGKTFAKELIDQIQLGK